LTSTSGTAVSYGQGAGDGFGSDRLIASAALREQESDDVLKGIGVGGVPQERAFASHGDEAFVLQLVEVMREGRCWNAKFGTDLTDNQSFRVSREQKTDYPQTSFGPERREHVGVAGNFISIGLGHRIPLFLFPYI
jgi:hypothetical protein